MKLPDVIAPRNGIESSLVRAAVVVCYGEETVSTVMLVRNQRREQGICALRFARL